VKDGLTFLDLIARQILALREKTGESVAFLLLNSFSTSEDTREYLARYPELGAAVTWELMQNRVPKVQQADFLPAHFPENPRLGWCPPGHGDVYAALVGSGRLEALLAAGYETLFVSNADNLGATLDLSLLDWFVASQKPFLMEVTPRTVADRKGGHLCRNLQTGGLRLREVAQCPPSELELFQDIDRHRYFNTNNLWIHLPSLQKTLDAQGGSLPLPLIINRKTLDPKDKHSTAVFQLETAMGAAIEVFPEANAVVVPRSRFAPVKTTSDLFVLRSDAYHLTPEFHLRLDGRRGDSLPLVSLDEVHYKLINQLEAATKAGVPSLRECQSLEVRGPFHFSRESCIKGKVTLFNAAAGSVDLPAGTYENTTWEAK
jgi:UTP--glucose-1-phosphate uridylyltransferase